MVEILVVGAILAILLALLVPALSEGILRAERTKFLNNMRSLGVAIQLYAGDHDGRFVGPLWPGQVVEYDPGVQGEGRLVTLLAPYLDIQASSNAYLVDRFLPSPTRRAVPASPPGQIRVFVMNMAVPSAPGETVNPWGSRAATPMTTPLRRAALPADSSKVWALSEAYRTHPRVQGSPWAANTPPEPVFGPKPLGLFFDGRVEPFDP